MANVVFGLDISHHQDLSLDLKKCKDEGIQFVFIKSTEGTTFKDPEFAVNLAEARAAGLLAGAYHYVRDLDATAQVRHIRSVVPLDVPVIPDFEANSGLLFRLREIVGELKRVGYNVPFVYIPRWYWNQIGSPSLVGLPPLWSSRYPNNIVGSLSSEFAEVPASYWNGYGGLGVAILQFTSSVRIAGHQPLDANAFRGTLDELKALFGQPVTTPREGQMKDLILAQEAGGVKTWVGDGTVRRHVADETELAGLQYWIGKKGGDPVVQVGFEDLRVLGVDIAELVGQAVTDYFDEHPPTVTVDVDYDLIAQTVVAEFKKEGN